MTLNIEATIRWKGYDPNDLSAGSSKRVWAVCNGCGKFRWVEFKSYRDLCLSCSHKGKTHSEATRKKLSELMTGNRVGAKNPNYGKTPSKETREKISEALIGLNAGIKNPNYGKHPSKETRNKMSEAQIGKHAGIKNHNYGKHPSKETLKKMSEAMTGKHPSKETLKKMSEAQIGKHLSKEHRQKLSDVKIGRYTGELNFHYGKHRSEETRKRLSAGHQGIPYDEWEGFAMEQKYCPAFNEACKESNRNKYGRKCFICGLPECENLTSTGKLRKLSVHHVDMNKQMGCDGNRWKLIPVCIHHHGTIHNKLWTQRIIYLLNTCWN